MIGRVVTAQVYLRICELGSLNAAARALRISRPIVSRYLEQMGDWAGARLIHRPTRQLTLTPVGEKMLLKTRGLTWIAGEITDGRQRTDPSDTLRIACTRFTAMQLISPLLPDFLIRHPQLRLELDINNRPVSLIGERIDVAIRITDNPESRAIARHLELCHLFLRTAPRWLQQHGPLATLDDLQQHSCLLCSHSAGQRWQFSDAQRQEASVAVSGDLNVGISSLLLRAAVAGCGIAMLPELEVRSVLANGALEVMLLDWTPRALSVYGIYLSRDYRSNGLPLFLDVLQRRLEKVAAVA